MGWVDYNCMSCYTCGNPCLEASSWAVANAGEDASEQGLKTKTETLRLLCYHQWSVFLALRSTLASIAIQFRFWMLFTHAMHWRDSDRSVFFVSQTRHSSQFFFKTVTCTVLSKLDHDNPGSGFRMVLSVYSINMHLTSERLGFYQHSFLAQFGIYPSIKGQLRCTYTSTQ
jgi:hypothetical protein